jgi:3-isopropylmalate/(R)-2-methylmalate dehydratase large subunit
MIEFFFGVNASKYLFLLYNNTAIIQKQLAKQYPFKKLLINNLVPNFSTDHIYPARYCVFIHNLGRYALTGYHPPVINEFDIERLQPKVLVGGDNFGCGSSREHAVLCLKEAGVKIIFALSLGRIFRENCIHNNLLISTDFSLLKRLIKTGRITVEQIIQPYSALEKKIIRSGGLLKTKIKTVSNDGKTRPKSLSGLTLCEKIILKNYPNFTFRKNATFFLAVDKRFSYEVFTPLVDKIINQELGPHFSIKDRESIFLFTDHFVFYPTPPIRDLIKQQNRFAQTHGIKVHPNFGDWQGCEGICHTLILENYALPGDIIVGTDSHTCSAGAVGALAFGVGATAMAKAFIDKTVLYKHRPITKITLSGQLPAGSCAKDVVLYLYYLQSQKKLNCQNHILEINGSGISHWPIDELQTLTNAAAELEAFTAIVEPTAIVKQFIRRTRQIRHSLFLKAGKNAHYDKKININLSKIKSLIAFPGSHYQVQKVSSIKHKIVIHKAFVGSCAGGKLEDLKKVALILKHRHVLPKCELFIQACSMNVYRQAVLLGLTKIYQRSGAVFLKPGCGACIGHGPGRILEGEVGISSSTRNFPGRMGPGNAYLASPMTVAASAVVGFICTPAILKKRNS